MILEIKNLRKQYNQSVAVDDVSFNIEEGEIFGLLGPNGAGKSTTINTIVGLLKMSSGSIHIFGKDFTKEAKEIKKNIGYVPQDLAFFEELSAIENVTYWGKLYGLRGTKLKAAVKEALEFTGLWERRKDTANHFSGGMKRRLNIACAIVHKPKLLLMDEPTVGVDPQSRNNILESIRTLNKGGTTIIYTSHYMEEIEAICNRVAIMDFGKIISIGTIRELIDSISGETEITLELESVTERMVNEIKKMDDMVQSCIREGNMITIKRKQGNISINSLLAKLLDKEIMIKSMNVEKMNLESVFLSLTGKKLRD